MAFGLTVRTPLTGSPNGSDCESEGFGLGKTYIIVVTVRRFLLLISAVSDNLSLFFLFGVSSSLRIRMHAAKEIVYAEIGHQDGEECKEHVQMIVFRVLQEL